MASLLIKQTKIESIQLAIFDKDGTIMELFHYWSQMIGLRAQWICQPLGLDESHAAALIYAMGVDRKAGWLRPEGPVGLKKREIVMQAAVDYLESIGQYDTHKLCSEAFEEVDRFSSSNLAQLIKPIPGAVELLVNLKQAGCKLAIATADRSARAALAMEHLGLKDKFDLIVGAEAVERAKPNPEMVFTILERLDVSKEHAVMVGDAPSDIMMGINAGLKASIAVLTGCATYEQCCAITPYVADSIAQIKVV